MKLAAMLIWAVIVSSTGQTAHSAIFNDVISRYGWHNHGFIFNVIGDTKKTSIDSNSLIADNHICFYDKVLTWIKDTYRGWVANDNSNSSRLLLLSFGLIGLLGIRRKFKKRRSTQYSGKKKKSRP